MNRRIALLLCLGTAAVVALSTGPNASPTARRAGSTGEPPPWESSAIRLSEARTSATSTARDGRGPSVPPRQRRSRPVRRGIRAISRASCR